MGFLEEIIAELPSKKFGGDTDIYFDKNRDRVLVVRYRNTYTYMVRDGSRDGAFILKTELASGKCINCPIENEGDVWIIPNIDHNAVLTNLTDGNTEGISRQMSNLIFKVSSYGTLENPEYKGSPFGNNVVYVSMVNSAGKVYAVPYLVSEGVRGCDGNPDGMVMDEAFRFHIIGTEKESHITVLI